MDVKELRFRNFMALLDGKTLEALAHDTASNPQHLSQIKNGKSMGPKVARRFERRLNLPHGWMDQAHSGVPTSPLAVSMLEVFDALPHAFQEHLVKKSEELREYADAMPGYIRDSLHRPSDPDKWRQWERGIESDMAAKKSASSERQ